MININDYIAALQATRVAAATAAAQANLINPSVNQNPGTLLLSNGSAPSSVITAGLDAALTFAPVIGAEYRVTSLSADRTWILQPGSTDAEFIVTIYGTQPHTLTIKSQIGGFPSAAPAPTITIPASAQPGRVDRRRVKWTTLVWLYDATAVGVTDAKWAADANQRNTESLATASHAGDSASDDPTVAVLQFIIAHATISVPNAASGSTTLTGSLT